MATTQAVVVPLGPAKVDITGVRAGDRNLITFALTSAGVPLDLTGLTVTAQARKKSTDEPAAINAVVEVTDETGGAGTLRWPGSDVTATLAGKSTWKGVWDLQIGSPGEDPVTIAAGEFSAEMDVTRP